MYLTRFRMNPTRRGSVRLFASPQRMHATVLSAFPPNLATSPDGRVLWRLDTPSNHEWNLYVVSPARPSMEQLQEECGWSQEQSWDTTSYGPFLDRLAPGQRWAFRLTANPVKSVAGVRGSRGRVVPHRTATHQRDWLLSKAERHGFTIPKREGEAELLVSRREQDSFSRGQGANRGTATLTRVQYDGLLTVTDPELLRTALTQGIGRGKAYGCGLLSLARVS